MKIIEELAKAGWFVKFMSDHQDSLRWRVWLRWPYGPLPHEEVSSDFETLSEATKWLKSTVDDWKFA